MKAARFTKGAKNGGRRDDVLEAAAALFATKGYAATSIRDIFEFIKGEHSKPQVIQKHCFVIE